MANTSWSSSSTRSPTSENEQCPYFYDGFVWRQEYLTSDTRENLIAVAIINSVAAIPTIVLNMLIILAVAARRRLQTNSNILVAWLAVLDLLSGLVVQPIFIAQELKRIFSHPPYCTLEKATTVAITGIGVTSFGILVVISIDRYISIKHPLRYQTIVTKHRIKLGLVLVLSTGVLVTIQEVILAVIDSGTEIYFRYSKVRDLMLVIFALPFICIVTYTYCYIYSETRRQLKRLQSEQVSQEEAKRMKKENKAANTLMMILGALVLTYLPTMVLVIVTAFSDNIIIEPRVIGILWSWITTFGILGSLFNPIIFFWRIKKLRRAPFEILHCIQPENTPPPIEMQEIQRHRLEIQPSNSDVLSTAALRGEPVLLSFRHLQTLETEETIHIE